MIEIRDGEVYCAKCNVPLTSGGLPLGDCEHFKWYDYGNYCFDCALYNKTPACGFITDIEICKRPVKKRVYVIQDGTTYYVLAPRK